MSDDSLKYRMLFDISVVTENDVLAPSVNVNFIKSSSSFEGSELLLLLFSFSRFSQRKEGRMGAVQSMIEWLQSLFWKQEMELTLVGLQNSGKTTLVNVLAVLACFFYDFLLNNDDSSGW